MYFPYIRGKQNELLVMRDQARLIASSHITPIIEPVKINTSPLFRAIDGLSTHGAEFIIVINPIHGDFKNKKNDLYEKLEKANINEKEGLILGYIIKEDTELEDFGQFLDKYKSFSIAIIHYGHPDPLSIYKCIEDNPSITHHIFIEPHTQRLYRKVFNTESGKVIVRDGFKKQQSNKNYPFIEQFSDLHVTYEDEGAEGFGDFLIVSDEYSESGGPAYAVAIHLTLIKKTTDMFIKHYVSDSVSTPADPGGKFREALAKLINDIERDDDIFLSNAINEYKKLHKMEHFPGLGYVKKLSMQHHIELLANYLTGK